MRWIFDTNRADFRPALPGEIEADPDALHIIQRGDVLMVCEDGRERPMPDQMEVAGVMFDRDQFTQWPSNSTTRTAIVRAPDTLDRRARASADRDRC